MKETNGSQNRYLPADKVLWLFWLCWTAYFVSNLGRLNYSAAMAEIIRDQGFTNAASGLVGTGFFICYGAGQLITGQFGDRVSPKWTVFLGIGSAGAANLTMGLLHTPGQMLAVWCVNGAAQAMIWAPILRIIAEYVPLGHRHKVCVYMATTYPVASIVCYVGSAAMVSLSGWRVIFLITAALMLASALFWLVALPRIERMRVQEAGAGEVGRGGSEAAPREPAPLPPIRLTAVLLAALSAILVVQGILRDGVTSWVPTFLNSTYQVGTTFSILSTTALPAVNLLGVWLAGLLFRRLQNELKTTLVFFAAATVAAAILFLAGGISLVASLTTFSMITASMMGINLMLISFVPIYFTRWGKVVFVSGLLNAMVYVGSSVATYGIGAVADRLGWDTLLLLLLLVALLGSALCLLAVPVWNRFLAENSQRTQ